MTFLDVTLDTQSVSASVLKALIGGGQFLRAAGILNTRWGEYSAQEIAQDVDLVKVEWETASDNTPGTLELTLWYPHHEAAAVRLRLAEMEGVDEYRLYGVP